MSLLIDESVFLMEVIHWMVNLSLSPGPCSTAGKFAERMMLVVGGGLVGLNEEKLYPGSMAKENRYWELPGSDRNL